MNLRNRCMLGACSILGVLASIDASAQVYGVGPGGAGYITTTAPLSPDCISPQVWTLSNGYYSCQNPPPPPPPSAPPGFVGSPNGYYALLLGYCGERNDGADHGSGDNEKWYCTTSLAGAARTAATIWNWTTGTPTFWLPASATIYQGFGIDSEPMAYMTGTTAHVVSGAVVGRYPGTVARAGSEMFNFECPANYPNIVVSTYNAYFATNPALIECGP